LLELDSSASAPFVTLSLPCAVQRPALVPWPIYRSPCLHMLPPLLLYGSLECSVAPHRMFVVAADIGPAVVVQFTPFGNATPRSFLALPMVANMDSSSD